MSWRARFSIGAPLGLAFIAALLLVDAWFLRDLVGQRLRQGQITFVTFGMGLTVLLSIPALLVLAYETLSCITLRYRLDRNGLVINWLGNRHVIPIRDIQRILPGRQLGNPIVRRQGLHWPGHERGTGLIPGIGRTLFMATRPLDDQILLIAPGQAYAISPQDEASFLSDLQTRQSLGPNRLLEPEVVRARWLTWPLWKDQTARALLGAATAVNLGLFAYLSARYPTLDSQLPLHFNSLGQVDRIGTKAELFALPIIGAIILATNLLLGLGLYRRERAGAYLLWGATAAAQALFWLAAFSLVP